MNKKGLFVALLLLLGHIANADVISVKGCKVLFETTGEPVLVKIQGKSENPCEGKVTIEGGKVTDSALKLELNKLDTGIPLRNKHLRENYLHTDKFPTAVFKITNIEDLEAQRSGSKKDPSKFEGTLELHGNTSPISNGTYQIKDNKVTSKFEVDLPNWKVERPSFMGVKIVDKVHVTVNFEM